MGHVHLKCGSGEFKEDELQLGDWMLARGDSWRAGTPRVRVVVGGEQGSQRPQEERSGPGERRRMRGRGGWFGGARNGLWREKKEDSAGSRKRGSMEVRLGEDLTDSASSPLKSAHQTNKEEVASDAKKEVV